MSSRSTQLRDQTSGRLLACARLGDVGACDRLLRRYLPRLRRFAHGRLARWTRRSTDTSDVIQDALLHTVVRLDTFERRGRDALGAYLRAAVENRIRDEHRRVARYGGAAALTDDIEDPAPSPLDRLAMREMEERYRAALAELRPKDRELVVAHVELDYTHEQLGCMSGRSPHAARMALHRAVRRLVERMDGP